MTKLVALVACAVALAACADPVILMKNPTTSQMARCQGDPAIDFNPARGAERCARAYEKAGFVRVDSF